MPSNIQLQLTCPRIASGKGLNEHRHHSHNTHLIVKGHIHMNIHKPTGFTAAVKGPGSWIPVGPGDDYMGISKNRGCVFVEGHKVLSPVTAMRFAARERATIIEVSADTAGAYYVESEDEHNGHEVVLDHALSQAWDVSRDLVVESESESEHEHDYKISIQQPSTGAKEVSNTPDSSRTNISSNDMKQARSRARAAGRGFIIDADYSEPQPTPTPQSGSRARGLLTCLLAAVGPACFVVLARGYGYSF